MQRDWEKWGYSAGHPRLPWLTFLGLALIVVSVYLFVDLGGVVGFLGGFAFFCLAGMAFSAAREARLRHLGLNPATVKALVPRKDGGYYTARA